MKYWQGELAVTKHWARSNQKARQSHNKVVSMRTGAAKPCVAKELAKCYQKKQGKLFILTGREIADRRIRTIPGVMFKLTTVDKLLFNWLL